ncbi:MAG: hypothetical protein V2A77_00405 [Pseudomonadota bacterium]
MSDQFDRQIAKHFLNISNEPGEIIGKPWDVVIGAVKGNGNLPSDPLEAVRQADSRLRGSFTVREAVERDLRTARLALKEVSNIKRNLERTVEELNRIQLQLSTMYD